VLQYCPTGIRAVSHASGNARERLPAAVLN